ncbi:MAG: glucosaminidase domain-containing protein [Saprospiraceae bacterium]|nr:glucosaminidase domain-containing protein [Saprospiraceae bacterium]
MRFFFRFSLIMSTFMGLCSFATPSEDRAAYDYIEQYKDLAVVEMHRSGIPASIILAQALHESNYGMSKLALEANNHFGIKCKSYWVGKTYYYKDDDFKNGQLIESCFRSYGSALESYVDHSNFLMSTRHYMPLFDRDHTDYKAWAYGLKECGYATDARYSEKLISKIEQYDLNQYDAWENPYRSILKSR